MKQRKVHKALVTPSGIYDLCSERISTAPFTKKWNDVTCRNCLKKTEQKGAKMTLQDLDAIARKWSFYRFFNTDEQKWVWYVQWEKEPCQWVSARGYTLEEAIKELEEQP